ncbi:MAG: tetratricopeptide repeat protein [Treponema sp.]|nr:tetratricopeptide repeat protein [Treponema sp.]
MRKLKEIFITLVLLVSIGTIIYLIHQNTSARTNKELTKRMAELSPHGGPPETIEGLRRAIALYEDQIERNVREGAQTGVYWKILATRLADRKMHNDALDALERAIHFNTEDPILYYLTGVSAGSVAKSIVGFSVNAERDRERYLSLAEKSYLRALELDITYTRAMYGLAVLYAFELNRPQDAIVQLERYMQILPSDIPAMFVLARSRFMLGELRSASEIYERIAERTRDKKVREEALNLRDTVQERLYE